MPDQPPRAIVAEGVEVETSEQAIAEAENVGQKILTGGVWRLLAYGFSTIVAVLSTAVVSRVLGPSDFAIYTTVLSLVAVGLGLSDFGLLALGIREFAALEGEARIRNMRALITLRVGFTLIAAIVMVIYGVIVGYSGGTMLGLIAAALGLTVISLFVSYCVPLQATYRFTELAFLDAARQGAWSGFMVLAALTVGTAGAIVAGLLPAAIIVTVAAAMLARRVTTIRPSWDPGAMRALLASVGAFAVASSVGASYAYLAQVASDSVLSSYESGQFALAFRVFVVLLGAGLVTILGAFPLLVTSARDDIERMVYACRRVMQTALIAGLVCAVGLLNGASAVVAVLGGHKYDDAVELLSIIGFALPLSFMLNTGSTVLLASGRHRELVYTSVIGATVSIGITAALSSACGAEGAAAGIVIGEFLICVAYLAVVSRIDRRAIPEFRWILGVLAAAGIGCAAGLVGLPSLASAILSLIIFAVALIVFRLLPPELADRIPFSVRASEESQ